MSFKKIYFNELRVLEHENTITAALALEFKVFSRI